MASAKMSATEAVMAAQRFTVRPLRVVKEADAIRGKS
jgi:hypothetical protein